MDIYQFPESTNWSIHEGEQQTISLTRSTPWWDGVCVPHDDKLHKHASVISVANNHSLFMIYSPFQDW